MCQVTPFTLPCCRRIYVSVEKLPSCPDGWPRKKCPRELIVQISGYEPKDVQHRNHGICWRCLADSQGGGATQRESMRPLLDKAFIVEGLKEWNMDERRVRVEKAGLCWHCGLDRACGHCGSGKTQAAEQSFAKAGNKRGHGEMNVAKSEGTNKKLKIDDVRSSRPDATSMAPAQVFEEQTLDPALRRHDYDSESYGRQSSYKHFTQHAPSFNYHPPQFQSLAAVPENESHNWQVTPSFQDQGFDSQNLGSGQIHSSLCQQQGEQQAQQNFILPQHQHEQQPPARRSTEISAELDNYNEETISHLFTQYNQDLKTEDQDEEKKHMYQVTATSQIDRSLEATPYQYTDPTGE